jgi:hypothetical protein
MVNDSSANASHSFWKVERREGMDVRVGGLGATILEDLRSMRSVISSSSPFTGSLWFSEIYASINRFSKTFPAPC